MKSPWCSMMSMASTSAPAAPSAEVNLPNVPGTRFNDTRRVSVLPADGWIVAICCAFFLLLINWPCYCTVVPRPADSSAEPPARSQDGSERRYGERRLGRLLRDGHADPPEVGGSSCGDAQNLAARTSMRQEHACAQQSSPP